MNKLTIKDLSKDFNNYENKEVALEGWVKTVRDSKTFGFIELNDGSFFNNIQIVFNDTLSNFEEICKLTISSSIAVTGTLVLTPNAKQPFEIQATKVEIQNLCPQEYPLQKKRHSFEYLRTISHLRPRTNTFNAVFRVRSTLAYAIHKFFQEKGFVYVNTPIITSSDCEGAGEMFNVSSFDFNNIPKTEDGNVSGNFYFIGNVDNPDEKVKEGTTRTVFSGDITDGKMIKTIQGGYEEGGDEVKLGDKLIPQYAYFLGTAPGEEYPRYWKETAPNDRASGGRWTQYSAIIISDQKIEKALGRNKPKEENPVKSLEIDFSEFNPEDVTAIEQIVEEAKANNVPVQYMNIVYDFNGNIVKKGDASLETLPEGMYIVNGKKYLVK